MSLPDRWLTTGCKEIFPQLIGNIGTCMELNKPGGGLWASPYTPDSEYPSPWVAWSGGTGFATEDNSEGVIFTLKDFSKIYIVDSREDIEALYAECGEIDICKELGLPRWFRKILNYGEVARKYDGIYLTQRGEGRTRDILYPYNLNGYDCESLVLFNGDCIESQEYIKL